MKISIVVPVYNVAPWIEGALRSVFAQVENSSEIEVECIVVDDCGTDDSMGTVQQLVKEASECGVSLHVVSHIQNRGLAVARNSGIKVATGDYLFCLDSDDQLELGALVALSRVAVAAGYPDWVQGNYRRVGAEGILMQNTIYYNPNEPTYENREAIVRGFEKLNFSNVTNKLIRLDFVRDNELSFCDGIIYEDVLWCMQAYGVVARVATLEAITYLHNHREGSIMRSDMTVGKMESLLYIVRELCQIEPMDVNVEHRAVFNAVYGMKHIYMGRFSKKYRRKWMTEMWATGVRNMDVKGAGLQPLSRLVGGAFGFPLWWARFYLSVMLWNYGMFLSIKGRG